MIEYTSTEWKKKEMMIQISERQIYVRIIGMCETTREVQNVWALREVYVWYKKKNSQKRKGGNHNSFIEET